jgi:hypothetical protein
MEDVPPTSKTTSLDLSKVFARPGEGQRPIFPRNQLVVTSDEARHSPATIHR